MGHKRHVEQETKYAGESRKISPSRDFGFPTHWFTAMRYVLRGIAVVFPSPMKFYSQSIILFRYSGVKKSLGLLVMSKPQYRSYRLLTFIRNIIVDHYHYYFITALNIWTAVSTASIIPHSFHYFCITDVAVCIGLCRTTLCIARCAVYVCPSVYYVRVLYRNE